jgi:hypothetical protein
MNLRKLIKEEIAKTLNEATYENIKVGSVLKFKDGETWKVTKFIGNPTNPRGIFALPYGDTKKSYVSVAIEFSMDDLKKSAATLEESVITEGTTKTILGVQFNVVPAQAGMKFEFKNVAQFRKSGITVNQLVDEITKMLNSKFGKGLFTFMPAGRDQTDPKVNGLEFRMNASNFFKGL